MGSIWFDGTSFFVVVFLRLIIFPSTVHSSCKVELCSREYARATDGRAISRGPSYQYCTVLQSYSDCIRATARSCRGNLEYHSISSLVMQWNSEFNCSNIIAQGPPEYPPYSGGRGSRLKPTATTQCSYRSYSHHGSEYTHCGLFGDPHLRTFHNEFQTCRVLGAWPLIDNSYLAVQVTNSAVVKGGSATATSKITVIIREHLPCTSKKTYEGQTDYLPGVFVDSTKSSGADKNVRIKEEDPGHHVEIYIRHISTRIVLRQVGHYLTFAIRMPVEVALKNRASDNLELCVKGCPKQEKIDYNQLLAHPDQWIRYVTKGGKAAMSVDQAAMTCREFNVTDFYFDACVFDLLTTGDSSFSQAARHAMKDVLTLHPASAASAINRSFILPSRVGLRHGDFTNRSVQRTLSYLIIATILILQLITHKVMTM